MHRPEVGRRAARVRRTALASLLVLAGAGTAAKGTRASSSADAAPEMVSRGRVVLNVREAALREQAERARAVARGRGLMLYRVLRLAALERRVPPAAPSGGLRLGGRAVALGAAVLQRDLAEARALHDEWERVRGVRGALPGTSDVAGEPTSGGPGAARPPALVPPVSGAVLGPYGVVRDPATSAWWFRSAVVLAAQPAEAVRAPLAGRVARVASSLSGGEAIALEADAAGWSVILSGLASVTVTPGQMVRAGEALGRAGPSPSVIRVEAWRGRAPVDPAALFAR